MLIVSAGCTCTSVMVLSHYLCFIGHELRIGHSHFTAESSNYEHLRHFFLLNFV
jgi:hypothetical protein